MKKHDGFGHQVITQRMSRSVQGLPAPDLLEAGDHLVELMRSINDSERQDHEMATQLSGEIERLEREYHQERKELVDNLKSALSKVELKDRLAALDRIHYIIQEQLAFVEFQRIQQRSIAQLHKNTRSSDTEE